MINDQAKISRKLNTKKIHADLVVVGGGMAGTCCAITAARKGIKVVVVQDRPVLGGNASSEVRLWILGATSHMGNNNRWAREGGVIDEILVENMYRNPEGNTIILDTILLEKVYQEPNITLLLNTAVYEVQKSSPSRIVGVTGFCSQNSTQYEIEAVLFCDASGDGIVGFQAGAAFRMGAESAEEFGEGFAPTAAYGELLGHSMYFMSKDVGKPVQFVAPEYALKDITKIPRYRKFNITDHGCWLWWLEYGGRLDTVHETETIKWELWKVIYGVWDYIKNSGKFPEAENYTLEWVGQIPGKRESRRFVGHYMLKQSDLVEQVHFPDAVAHGGWALDLHPADGVFSEKPGCNQWHCKGVYEIPYRSMISQNIENLFLAGRIISASHVAFASTRVMATCAQGAQAVGMAAALAIQNQWSPTEIIEQSKMQILQQELLKAGQHIPHLKWRDSKNLLLKNTTQLAAKRAYVQVAKNIASNKASIFDDTPDEIKLTASSHLQLSEIPFDGDWKSLNFSSAQLIPLSIGQVPVFEIGLRVNETTTFDVSLRKSSKTYNYTPEIILKELSFELSEGEQLLVIDFEEFLTEDSYYFICFHKNDAISLRQSQTRITGLVSVFNKQNVAVSNYGRQDPSPDLGFEAFEFWVPIRRPKGQNFAMRITPALDCFGVENLNDGFLRPYLHPNAWIASLDEEQATLIIEFPAPQKVESLLFFFDTDLDHAMESSLLGHPERVMPFTVRDYTIRDENDQLIHETKGNYQTRNEIIFDEPLVTRKLTIQLKKPSVNVPVALYGLSVF